MLSTLQVHKHSFSDPGKPDEEEKREKRERKKPLCVHSDTETTSTDSHNIHSSTDLICYGIVTDITISLSYWHTRKTARARQDHSP